MTREKTGVGKNNGVSWVEKYVKLKDRREREKEREREGERREIKR